MSTKLSRILSSVAQRIPATLPIYKPPSGSNTIWPTTATLPDCGAMTANVWKEILSIQSPGVLRYLCLVNGTPTSKMFGLRIKIDGVAVSELMMTSNSSTARHGITTDIAAVNGAVSAPTLISVPFNTLTVEAVSTVTLTAGASLQYFADYYLVN